MTRSRRYGKIRSFIITKSNRRATLVRVRHSRVARPPPMRSKIISENRIINRTSTDQNLSHDRADIAL